MKLLQQSRGMQQPTLSFHSYRILLLFHWPLESIQDCVCVCVPKRDLVMECDWVKMPTLLCERVMDCHFFLHGFPFPNQLSSGRCFCVGQPTEALCFAVCHTFFFLLFWNFVCTSIIWTHNTANHLWTVKIGKNKAKGCWSSHSQSGLTTTSISSTNISPVFLPARIQHS